MKTKKLYRSEDDKMIAGVAGGIARYFEVDATLVRIAFVVAGLFSHGGIVLLYILLAVLIKKKHDEDAEDHKKSDDEYESESSAKDNGSSFHHEEHSMHISHAVGLFLISVGILVLLAQFISFAFIPFRLIFAITFLLIGAYLFVKRT